MVREVLVAFFSLVLPASATQVLRTLPQVQNACEQRQSGAFDCSGTVLIPPTYPRAPLYVALETNVQCFYDIRTNKLDAIAEGDLVRLIGRIGRSSNDLQSNPGCFEITVVSPGRLPSPLPIDIKDLAVNYPPNRYVALKGMVRDVFADDIDPHYSFVILEEDKELVYLACSADRSQLPALRSLRGSTVTVSGITENTGSRHSGKVLLIISGTNAFHVIRRSSDTRFDAPPICTSDLNRPGDLESLGLRKICGTVLATWHEDSFLLIDTNGCPVKVELAEPSLPTVLESVETVGYPETDLFHLSLVRASWRRQPAVNPISVPVVNTSIKDIYVSPFGRYCIPTDMHGKILHLRGTVKSILLDEHGGSRIILSDGIYTIPVDGSNLDHSLSGLKEGCLVEITGVCIKDSDIWRPSYLIPRVRGLFLVPRSSADLKILRQPPWWTPIRFVIALIVLLALIVVILIWNASLRILVTRKSRALLREQAAKLEETLKIDERTRLAAELHDYLAQNLTVISYQVSAAESALAVNSAETAECLKTADRMLLSCRADLRRCLWDLKSDALNEPEFAKAIERTSEPVSGDARLLVRFAVSRNRLNDSTAHAILSICRELVANAVRHGKADKVQIAGELKDGALRFSVRDNGIGFDPTTRPGQTDGHFGLDGVAERIRRLNGELQIASTPGKGTRIVVTLRPKDSPT